MRLREEGPEVLDEHLETYYRDRVWSDDEPESPASFRKSEESDPSDEDPRRKSHTSDSDRRHLARERA